MEVVNVQITGVDVEGDAAPEEYQVFLSANQNPFTRHDELTAHVVPDPFGVGTDYLVIGAQGGPGAVPARLLLEDVAGNADPELAVVSFPSSLRTLVSGSEPGLLATGAQGQALIVPLPAELP